MRELKMNRSIRELIPSLTSQEYADLEASIVAEGCREPIVVWKGEDRILDGHNRYDICVKNNIEFTVKEKEFATKKDALLWMYNNQLGRRNLSDANRIEMELARAKLIGGNIAPEKVFTHEKRKEIAEKAGVSERTVAKVKVVQDEGTKKVKKDMHDGKISIEKAYKETRHIEEKPKEPSPPPTPEPEKPSPTPPPSDRPEGAIECRHCSGKGWTLPIISIAGKCGLCGSKLIVDGKCKICSQAVN
jgi:ParB-like chromosome segregation protein Spo0J